MPGVPLSRATIPSTWMRRWIAAYYDGLIAARPASGENSGRAIPQLMANHIDRINLVWLLRYRFNYKLPPAQVYYLLVGSHYSLARLTPAGTGRARKPGSGAGRVARALERTPVRADRHSRRIRAHGACCRRTGIAGLRADAPDIARAFAYLILRERDLRAVRAVLRGRHLGLADRRHPDWRCDATRPRLN